MILTTNQNQTLSIQCFLDYERGLCNDIAQVCFQIPINVLHVENPFTTNRLSFVLHGQPLKIWKKVYDKEILVNLGDLHAKDIRLESEKFNVSEYSPILRARDVSHGKGGYVYVIDGNTGKYLCTLDYLYCFNHGITTKDRNPFSVSNVTGLRPISEAISNGLYWQKIITNNCPRVKGDLYYSNIVGSEFQKREKSLYWSMESYIEDYDAYMFGVAIAYAIDEALDHVNDTERCVTEKYYSSLWPNNISDEVHSLLWSITSTRRHCQVIQTAMCLMFTPTIYSNMLQAMDSQFYLLSGDMFSDIEEGRRLIDNYPEDPFETTFVYDQVHPFLNLQDLEDAAESLEDVAESLCLKQDRNVLLNRNFEQKYLLRVSQRLDLGKALTAFKVAVDDWLHYLYTPYTITFPKQGVPNKPSNSNHGLEFIDSALGSDVYITHNCGKWTLKPKDVSFVLCKSADHTVLSTYVSPIEALRILFVDKYESACMDTMWDNIFKVSLKAIAGIKTSQIVETYKQYHLYRSLLQLIVFTCSRTKYIYHEKDAVEKVYSVGENVNKQMRKTARNVAYACSSYDWLDFVLDSYKKGYLNAPSQIGDQSFHKYKFKIPNNVDNEMTGNIDDDWPFYDLDFIRIYDKFTSETLWSYYGRNLKKRIEMSLSYFDDNIEDFVGKTSTSVVPLHVKMAVIYKYFNEDVTDDVKRQSLWNNMSSVVRLGDFQQEIKSNVGYAVSIFDTPGMWTVFSLNSNDNNFFVTYKLIPGKPIFMMENVDVDNDDIAKANNAKISTLLRNRDILYGRIVDPYIVDLMHTILCIKGSIVYNYGQNRLKTFLSNILGMEYTDTIINPENQLNVQDINTFPKLNTYISDLLKANQLPSLSLIKISNMYELFVNTIAQSTKKEEPLLKKRRRQR
uniref:Uncharacterized protein n=1 Tax=Ixodes ricinus TaxID=34613 RepID=A0A0K8RFS6_IXORI